MSTGTTSSQDLKLKEDLNEPTSDNHPSNLAFDEALIKAKNVSSVYTVVLSGIALASDGYVASIVGYTNIIFKYLYGSQFTKILKTRVSNAYLIGEIFGMLFFGTIIDRYGRKSGIIATTTLLVLGLVISTAASGATVEGLIWMLIIGRGISGVGAGGEYPVCAVSSAEASDENDYVRKHRGLLVGLIGDTAIDMGFVISGLVILIVLAIYGATGSAESQIAHLSEGIWRISIGLAILPPLFIFYSRYKIMNSTVYQKSADKGPFPWKLVFRRYWKTILGTTLCWALYDAVSYPFGLFGSSIIDTLGPGGSIIESIGYGTVINAFYVPGALAGAFLMDRIGRRNTQMYGFLVQAIIGFILGGALFPIQNVFPLFITMYGVFVAIGELPGSTTLLISSEVYPTSIRGKMFGLSAAFGKVGATVGTQLFGPIQDSFPTVFSGQQGVFLIGSAVALLGALATYLLIPEMDRDLNVEDAAFKAYLEENGWDTSSMGESLEKSATKNILDAMKE